MTVVVASSPSPLRSHRRRKITAAACSLLGFASTGSILLGGNEGGGELSGTARVALSEETSSANHSPSPKSSSSWSPLSPSLLSWSSRSAFRGTNGTRPLRRRAVRTFYHPLSPSESAWGASHDGQVELWKRAWADAGWDARVLTLDDARRHPRYDQFKARIDALDWCAPEGSIAAEFQKLCFVRWIAYASDGAGYVSDYDILPLGYGSAPSASSSESTSSEGFFPNGGAFTAHDNILASFASAGSGEEYERVLEAMLDAAEEHRKPKRPEDENAGPSGRRSRGMECFLSDGNEEENETKWQITDMQALQVLKYAMWKGHVPPDTLHVPPHNQEEQSPCKFVVNELEFEEWTIGHPGLCPGAVHFSGKRGMERDGRLETSRAMWEDFRMVCSTRKECAVLNEADGKVGRRQRRYILSNLVAGASILTAVVAAML